MITYGLSAPPVHSPNSPNSPNFPNQPTLHHYRSLEHFGHISATFPTIFPFFCSTEQRKCISRYHWVSSSIRESLRETSSATFRHRPFPPCFRPTIRRKPAQEANVGDHEVVIGFVPLLGWSPHSDVADKALINLSCKYVIEPRLPLSRVC